MSASGQLRGRLRAGFRGRRQPESTVVITGDIDTVVDSRLGGNDVRVYQGRPTATVAQSLRPDRSHGERDLEPPGRGDTDWSLDFTADQRLTAVGFKSTGVGAKVVGAGVKVMAMVAGTAARLAVPTANGHARLVRAFARQSEPAEGDEPAEAESATPPDEGSVRKKWERTHEAEVVHLEAYVELADTLNASLLRLRQELAACDSAALAAPLVRRSHQLIALLDDARAESAKVEGLYRAWCDANMVRVPRHLTFTLAIDELPQHTDPTSFDMQEEQSADGGLADVWKQLWEDLGVRVEIGGVPPGGSWRPNTFGVVDSDLGAQAVQWRRPRPARVWIWRRDEGGTAALEKVVDTLVTDRYSLSGSIDLNGRWFGESSMQMTMDDLGAPSRIASGDKSAAGAIADAISSVPEQVMSTLEAVSKASTALTDLSATSAEQRLKSIKRQVEQRTQELELLGLNASAEDFAELKRLKQRVEIAEAQSALAPPSGLATLEDQLAKQTARRDLEAVSRERTQAAELAATRSEIAQLAAEVELLKLRKQAADEGDGTT